jgi:hypothetical protein
MRATRAASSARWNPFSGQMRPSASVATDETPGAKGFDVDAVRDHRRVRDLADRALRTRDADEPYALPRRERVGRIVGRRQVERDDGRRLAPVGEIGGEVDAVEVDEVDALARQHGGDHAPHLRMDVGAHGDVEGPVGNRDRHELAADARAGARDHDRAHAALHHACIERGEHLLGATDRIGPDRREGMRHGEDGEHRRWCPHPRATAHPGPTRKRRSVDTWVYFSSVGNPAQE